MQTVALWQLGLVIHAVWFCERLKMPKRLLDLITHPVHQREVAALAHCGQARGAQGIHHGALLHHLPAMGLYKFFQHFFIDINK